MSRATDKRILFLGSGPFALPALDVLAERFHLSGVVTQPDRGAGRGRRRRRGLVAERAEALRLPVLQPASLRLPDAVAELRANAPDLLVVASYGQILSREVLDLASRGALNLHPSLLPRHRGPSPVAAAVLAGDSVTGVTIMKMVRRMDAGPILAQRCCVTDACETAETLTQRLAVEGAALMAETILPWLAGEIHPRPQNEDEATYTRLLTKEDGRIDWTRGAVEIQRQVRAYVPWPVAFTCWDGGVLRVHAATALPATGIMRPPGQVAGIGSEGIQVATGEGVLLMTELQAAGGRRVQAGEYARGHPGIAKARLSSTRP